MKWLKRTVFYAGLVLFALWFWPNRHMFTGDQEGFIRLVLGGFFALCLLFRLKPRRSHDVGGLPVIVGAGLLGAVLTVVGIALRMHQFEWLGIILVFFSCLRWALPDRWASDIVRSLFLVYWIHPLPGRLFGWFEVLMQKLSVWGSEWMLHIFNVRVWAEGIYLRTGHNVFGVPEECSGMRTAVTMLICVVGVSMLMRQRWWETLLFMLIGGVQVLVLNMVRIAFMVAWAPRMPAAWGSTFLHDSLSIFLFISIFLIQIEMSWWKVMRSRLLKKRKLEEQGVVEAPEEASVLPPIWRLAAKYAKWAFLVLLIISAFSYAQYKRRDSHRAAMVSDVVDGLIDTDLAAAEAAVKDALSFMPGSRELLVKKAHVLILRKKHQEVIEIINGLGQPLEVFEIVLKSWALMSLNQPQEAMALVRGLPASSREIPGVAIVEAEYAAIMGEVGEAAKNVMIASKSSMTVERVRILYFFLAKHEQWRVIAESNHIQVPLPDVETALVVFHAYVKTGNLTNASRVLEYALGAWPDNMRLLNALYFMAVRRPGQKWEHYFAANFEANVKNFDAADTAVRMDMAFELRRPDLGWLAFRRLESLDPADPALFLAVAKYGEDWFVFRRNQIGIRIFNGEELINLASYAAACRDCSFFQSFWRKIPYSEELSSSDKAIFQVTCLQKALEELRLRMADGSITPRMEAAYPTALGMAGRYDEAHKFIDMLMAKHPERRTEMLLQHAELYHAQNRWEESYEHLRLYMAEQDYQGLIVRLMLADNLSNMNLGLYALEAVRGAKQSFPGSMELRLAEASLWSSFGFYEQALHLLGDAERRSILPLRMQLLFRTGRYNEAGRLARVLGATKPDLSGVSQMIALAPADMIMTQRWSEPFSREELDRRLSLIADAERRVVSPFLKRLLQLERDFFRGNSLSAAEWASAGRDSSEKAAALHRLAALAGRQGMPALALSAVKEAVKLMPNSPVLWRILIALEEGHPETVKTAMEMCPDDPEIWLASIVERARAEAGQEEMLAYVSNSIKIVDYPEGTVVRAADYLLGRRYASSAFLLMESVSEKSKGLLAADMMNLRCALVKGDFQSAMSACLSGVKNALDPVPFYKMIVSLKSAGRMADGQLVEALENLRTAFPQEKQWAENLGMVYFERGDVTRALSLIDTLIREDAGKVSVRSFLLAAESARREGRSGRAVEILRLAYKMNPDNKQVLNNLVYYLAEEQSTLREAVRLLPQLEKMGQQSFHVLDTIAMVHMKAGNLDEAAQYMEKALAVIDRGSYSAGEVLLNSAELMIKSGRYDSAEKTIMEIRGDSMRTDMIDRRARQLLEEIRRESVHAPE